MVVDRDDEPHALAAVAGHPLGDRTDQAALAAGYDRSDWLWIGNRHLTKHTRGRITTSAYPLRPVEVAVRGGVRAPGTERDGLRRPIDTAWSKSGRPGSELTIDVSPWLGVGPALLTRS